MAINVWYTLAASNYALILQPYLMCSQYAEAAIVCN